MLPVIGSVAAGLAANQGLDFIKGQAENYAKANGPDFAWGGAKAAVKAVAQGVLGNNIAGAAVGNVAGAYVGAEAGAAAAGGLAVDAVQLANNFVQKTDSEQPPEETGYLGTAASWAGWAAKRFARNFATVKLVDTVRDAAFNGVYGAAKGIAGNAVGGVVGYVPAAMAGWKAGALAAGGPAAVAAAVAVDVLAPVAINYAAPIVANAAYDVGVGAYNYFAGPVDQAEVKKVTQVFNDVLPKPQNGKLVNRTAAQAA